MRSNPIAARLRQVVSQDRMRYKDEETGTDMDLSYITNTIIGKDTSSLGEKATFFAFSPPSLSLRRVHV